MTGVDAAAVRAALVAHRVTFLTVLDSVEPHPVVLVYLHGNAGLSQQEEAVRVLRELDGVREVKVSDASWTILTVSARA